MKIIQHNLFAYQKAHEIIWKLGYWRYLLIPVILSVTVLPLLLALLIASSIWASSLIETYFSSGEEASVWVSRIILALLLAAGFGTGYVLYRNLIMVCYGPFLDRLSVKAEILVNGESNQSERPVLESLIRPLLITAYAVAASIATLLIGGLLGLVPLVGPFLMIAFLFPTQLFLGAAGYLDPYLERKGYSPRESFRLMRRHALTTITFALVGLLIFAIPFVGWFVAPTYSAVAGIVLAILMADDEK